MQKLKNFFVSIWYAVFRRNARLADKAVSSFGVEQTSRLPREHSVEVIVQTKTEYLLETSPKLHVSFVNWNSFQ